MSWIGFTLGGYGLVENIRQWMGFLLVIGFWAYICIQIGIAAAHGWPELVSDRMNLSPKLQYEEE